MNSPKSSLSTDLAHQVEAFEGALADNPAADLAAFLPDHTHPLYLTALGELVRVDLEHAWSRNVPKRLAEYRTRFPRVFENPTILEEVAFEEFRQRRRHGEK